MQFSRLRLLKTACFLGFFVLLGGPLFADFTSDDSTNLQQIRDAWWAVDSSSDYSNAVGMRRYFTQTLSSIPSWGGNFIKTVGNAASKFVQEFDSNGWFPAVKAGIGAIQADVGRIHTSLTDANTHLEIIADNTSSIKDNTESIKDNTESIDTSVTSISSDTSSIKSSVSNIDSSLSSFYGLVKRAFTVPLYSTTLFKVSPNPNQSFVLDRPPNFITVTRSTRSFTNFYDAIFQSIYELQQQGVLDNAILANTLIKQHGIYITSVASTNLLQSILDTNDVWYARIYNKIPNSISISNQLEAVIGGINNIVNISNNVNDGSYTPETFNHNYGYVLDNPFPFIYRDVQNANMLGMPVLTGDFRRDIVLLASYINAYSTSISASQMDILTNVQVVANAILSAHSQLDEKSREIDSINREIIARGEALEGSIDSVSSYFDLIGGNSGISDYKDNSTFFGDVLDRSLNVSEFPENITMRIPALGDDSENFFEFVIDLQDHQIASTFRTIRQFMAFFWWGLGFGIALYALNLGIRLVGWLSSIFFPSTYGPAITSYANNKEAGLI